ncbi:NAD(P)/FAD-dependent oxidoreductase [Nocardia sp. NPDC050406]|uniref:NAD(P)/FAD-dependent oxidoreductase n=1 Tax=Nocardia sp. NPDC050406 TaxID=3364318 RepID=UPI0037A4F938
MSAAARMDAFSDWGDARRAGRLRGAESFLGPQVHCARWRQQTGIAGKRVAIVGTGAAVARILPPIAAKARRVTVFQHDPVWVLPYVPGLGRAEEVVRLLPSALTRRVAAVNLRVQVRDSWIRRQLTPESSTAVACHNRYYRTLRRPNCKLVTWPIARLAPHGIRTVDGIEHRVDCIIYAEENP